MKRVWRIICSYVWWTHQRGSLHYDVMVSIILLFIFLAPHWINFNDKPTERNPHQSGVVVLPDGEDFVYRIDASAVSAGANDEQIRQDLVRVIEPIAGEIVLLRFEPVRDHKGHIKGYKAWVKKPYR